MVPTLFVIDSVPTGRSSTVPDQLRSPPALYRRCHYAHIGVARIICRPSGTPSNVAFFSQQFFGKGSSIFN
jgi:hypothetical protein